MSNGKPTGVETTKRESRLLRGTLAQELAAGGTQILVPETEVPRVRLMLAREGLPAGGSVG